MQKVNETMNSNMTNYLTNYKAWAPVTYNVAAYGIVGDGIKDNTAAIQSLIYLAISEHRKAIFFQPGIYIINELVHADKVVFFGDNATVVGSFTGKIHQIGVWANNKDITEIEEQVELKADKTQVNQLATSKADKDYVDEQLENTAVLLSEKMDKTELTSINNKIDLKADKSEVREKSVLINVNDVDADLLAAISGGTTVSVLSVPKAQSVSPGTLNGVKNVNLLNKNSVTNGYYVTNAGVYSPQGSVPLYISEYIPVIPGQVVTIPYGQASQGGYYNESQTWISALPSVSLGTVNSFTIPTGVSYIRVNGEAKNLNTDMVLLGNSVPDIYVEYGGQIDWLKVTDKNLGADSVTTKSLAKGNVTPEKLQGSTVLNMFNKSTVTSNKYLNNSGVILESTTLSLSDYISVEEGETYILKRGFSSLGGYFDNDKNWISRIANTAEVTPYVITIPAGIRYARFNIYNSEVDSWMLVPGDIYPVEYQEYGWNLEYLKVLPQNLTREIRGLIDLQQKWNEKKIVTFGDSITWYDGRPYNANTTEAGVIVKGYQSYIREILGSTVINQGVSGETTPQISSRIQAYDFSDVDIVTILAGTNDFRDIATEDIGAIEPIGSLFNQSTFIGAYQAAIEYILTSKPSIKLLLLTPIKGWTRSYGLMPETYPNAVKELGKLYSLPVCDLYQHSGINDLTKSVLIVDTSAVSYAFHPSTKGYERMADIIVPFLKNH